jgi:small subunit ribosomal protein S1
MRKPPLRNARQPIVYSAPHHNYYGATADGPADGAVITGEESFAQMFEASLKSPRKAVARRDPELGELVQGEIVQISGEYAFLDIGGKSEAMIALDELRGENGEINVNIGDKLEGHVMSTGGKEGGLLISGRVQRGAGLSDQIRSAHQQGAPVQGLVTGVNKGGLDIDLGGVRAFLPASQLDLRYCQDPSVFIGRALTLRVTRFDEEARAVVVSRRAILEVELKAAADQNRARLHTGAVFAGTVVALREPVAIVDLGGIDGTLPTAEIHAALTAAGRDEENIKLGQRVEVSVLRIEEGRGNDPWLSSLQGNLRIALSMRGLLADPLDEMLSKLEQGQRVSGRIVRLEPFGAFVELQPGVEGLIHISAMCERHITHPREVLGLGQELTATVINLDRERRRIGLSLIEEVRAAQAAVAATLTQGQRVKVRIERIEPNGAIVRVQAPAATDTTQPRGLIPNSELNVPRGSDIKRLFPVGREHIAAVQSVDGEGRVRLSLRVVAEQDRAAAEAEAAAAAAAQAAAAAAEAEAAAAAAASLRAASATTPKKQSRVRKTPVAAAAADGTTTAEKKKPAPRRAKTAASEVSPVPEGAAETVEGAGAEPTPVRKARASRKKTGEHATVEPTAAEHVATSVAAIPQESPAPKVAKKRPAAKSA